MTNLLEETQNFLRKSGLSAKKTLGQNFLIDPEILSQIVSSANLQSADTVVEVGAGLGTLTAELVSRAQKVVAVELDSDMTKILRQRFSGVFNLEIREQTVLDFVPLEKFKLIANIPYYLTGKILRHFLVKNGSRPTRIVLLVQKEVAERICARAGQHSLPSLLVQNFGTPKIEAQVAPGCFLPAPQVSSAVLSIKMHPAPKIADFRFWLDFAEQVFRAKRKTLLNALHFLGSKTEIQKFLENCEINPQLRAQNLDFGDWERIMAEYKKYKKLSE